MQTNSEPVKWLSSGGSIGTVGVAFKVGLTYLSACPITFRIGYCWPKSLDLSSKLGVRQHVISLGQIPK